MSRVARALIVTTCLLAGLLATAAPALAADITVDSGAADGVDEVTPECSLREAIDVTNGSPSTDDCTGNPGDRIVLPPGTIAVDDDSIGSVVITDDVEIVGAGMAPSGTIIDATGLLDSVFVVNGSQVGFSDVTITGGSGLAGGAILSFGDLTLTRVELDQNVSLFGGGLAASGLVEIVDSIISNNEADDGGGINLGGATGVIRDSVISGNNAAFDGGGIWADASDVTVTGGSVIDDNEAGDFGGGIWACGCSPTTIAVRDSDVINNTATDGGGMAAGPADLTIEDSTFDSNGSTNSGGGLLLIDEGRALISGTTFSSNTAVVDGGAISAWEEGFGVLLVEIVNSTLSGNAVTDPSGVGGAIATEEPMTLTHTTVTDNRAFAGGGLALLAGASVTARNSLIGGQQSGGDCDGPLDDDGGNLDSDGSCLGGPGSSLGLTSLQENGGPTRTHALLGSSPAIDFGESLWCEATDQRGIPRPSASCDSGAFEFVVTPPPPVRYELNVVVNGEGRVTGSPQLGIDCGTVCSNDLSKGTTGRLIATPKSGYAFDGWSGGCTTIDGDECAVSLETDVAVTADFALLGTGDIAKGRCKGMTMGTIDILSDGTVMRAGTAADDVLRGSAGPDVICGLAGNDTLKGKSQNDVLLGGAGDDKLIGGKGDDRLNGGGGTDSCLGGKGKNKLIACE